MTFGPSDHDYKTLGINIKSDLLVKCIEKIVYNDKRNDKRKWKTKKYKVRIFAKMTITTSQK